MKKYLPWILIAAALLLAGVIVLTLSTGGADELLSQISGVWYREGSDDWHLEFVVEDGTMEYRFVSAQFPDISETLYTYGYEVRNAGTIEVQYPEGEKQVNVTLSEDGAEMTFTPAVTSAEDSEVWVRRTE